MTRKLENYLFPSCFALCIFASSTTTKINSVFALFFEVKKEVDFVIKTLSF
jgi:hypothetical protein